MRGIGFSGSEGGARPRARCVAGWDGGWLARGKWGKKLGFWVLAVVHKGTYPLEHAANIVADVGLPHKFSTLRSKSRGGILGKCCSSAVWSSPPRS